MHRRRPKAFKSSTIIGMVTTFVMFVALALMMSNYSDNAPNATLPPTLPETIPAESQQPESSNPLESVPESQAGSFAGKVIGKADGDTIDVLTDDK